MSPVDITGVRYGRLIAVRRVDSTAADAKRHRWEVVCDCGTVKTCLKMVLMGGKTVSCGCISRPRDIIGMTFASLTVLSYGESSARGQRTVVARCSCGNEHRTLASRLTSGHTRSCGCLKREIMADLGRRGKVHGQSRGSQTYRSWLHMHERCRSHPNYAGRITVCERWSSFEAFVEDMGERPDGMTLDRHPNQGGNYELGNCRWATPKQQGNNTRSNVLVEHDSVARTISEWADHYGFPYPLLLARLKRGQSLPEAIQRVDGRGKNGPSRPNQNAAKLGLDQAAEVRRLHTEGQNYRAIADRFSVSRSLVGAIVRGEAWSVL